MILSAATPANVIKIWQPRWHDKMVLIAKYKVGNHNEITFSKSKSHPDKYYMSGDTIRQYPIETNGTISCYVVPLRELELLEREN